jgi:hypothetical protein
MLVDGEGKQLMGGMEMANKIIKDGEVRWEYICNHMDDGFACGNKMIVSDEWLDENPQIEALYCAKCGNYVDL